MAGAAAVVALLLLAAHSLAQQPRREGTRVGLAHVVRPAGGAPGAAAGAAPRTVYTATYNPVVDPFARYDTAAGTATWVSPAVSGSAVPCSRSREANPHVDECVSCTRTHPCRWCEATSRCEAPNAFSCATGWAELPPQCPRSYYQGHDDLHRLPPGPPRSLYQRLSPGDVRHCRARDGAGCHACTSWLPCQWCPTSRTCSHVSQGACAGGWQNPHTCALPSWFRDEDKYGSGVRVPLAHMQRTSSQSPIVV